jgi:hypothetical protein
MRFEDGAKDGGAVALLRDEGEIGSDDVATAAVAVAGGAKGDLGIEEEAAARFDIGSAGKCIQRS